MKAQVIKEHLFAEDVHFFNSDEQRNRTGSNNRAEKSKRIIFWLNLNNINIHISNTFLIK